MRTSATDFSENLISVKNRKNKMDRGMASSLPTEKVNRSNYASWSYKMHQYLLGHGYWSYVDGPNDTTPDSAHRDFLASNSWQAEFSTVLYLGLANNF